VIGEAVSFAGAFGILFVNGQKLFLDLKASIGVWEGARARSFDHEDK
jgi:hypothetical protein